MVITLLLIIDYITTDNINIILLFNLGIKVVIIQTVIIVIINIFIDSRINTIITIIAKGYIFTNPKFTSIVDAFIFIIIIIITKL